jgi:hypothetical protein
VLENARIGLRLFERANRTEYLVATHSLAAAVFLSSDWRTQTTKTQAIASFLLDDRESRVYTMSRSGSFLLPSGALLGLAMNGHSTKEHGSISADRPFSCLNMWERTFLSYRCGTNGRTTLGVCIAFSSRTEWLFSLASMYREDPIA